MTNSVDALILDLLEWIGPKPRAYAEVMEDMADVLPAPAGMGGSQRARLCRAPARTGQGGDGGGEPSGTAFLNRHRPQTPRTNASSAASAH